MRSSGPSKNNDHGRTAQNLLAIVVVLVIVVAAMVIIRKLQLGIEHLGRGDERAARECFEALLEMNPNDNQGVRQALEAMDAVAASTLRI